MFYFSSYSKQSLEVIYFHMFPYNFRVTFVKRKSYRTEDRIVGKGKMKQTILITMDNSNSFIV